jgi:hypothetical protein
MTERGSRASTQAVDPVLKGGDFRHLNSKDSLRFGFGISMHPLYFLEWACSAEYVTEYRVVTLYLIWKIQSTVLCRISKDIWLATRSTAFVSVN